MMNKSESGKYWTVPVTLNKDGDTVIEFPDDLLEHVKWKEGDTLEWKTDASGLSATITRVGEMVKLHKEPVEEQLNLNLK